ncbi:hypothetical protein L207DRAFT_489005 [Hyaloscypha variabilis F]|uniref:Pentatricopeptide repeat domain-containing protein n=1 Tax=Hyaloscypha variabilis (strain UAMH 11265 / GT02V1 / F) TaxID=1149755 RepID=A0A2J6RR66_HYAVF|nr:hypothetical protein L207DRAFT_489005 [Hyaloscypha variabilis F]
MGPALQRLLLRPSSLELLRYLVGTPVANAPRKRAERLPKRVGICGRRHVSIAATAQPASQQHGLVSDDAGRISLSIPRTTESSFPIVSWKPSQATELLVKSSNNRWDESLFTHEELEFETSLDAVQVESGRVRLLDRDGHREDLKLWACLLGYRKRVHGSKGVLTFWRAVQKRNLHLPTQGSLAEKFWPEFLALGFQNHTLLEEVCKYADRLLDENGERWSKLYVSVIEHFLVTGQGTNAIKWHDRLFKLHPPGYKVFAGMCRYVALKDGDMETLRSIYTRNKHRNIYSRIVPLLCQREDFKSALSWHFFFVNNGDLPAFAKLVEPLVHFLAIYDRPNALKVTKSLVDAGVSFGSSISNELQDNTKISREMMNLVHGKTFNVSVKKYNDNLGARWFATRWISLDVAINAVHALGVQEIGPLSLQAIALREPDTKSVVVRIAQLKNLGISIGRSLFSQAVEHFARNRKSDLLESLLSSDQHPEALENGELQESLLNTYATAKDWTQYRRTLAIRSLVSKSPQMEKSNIILRYHVTRGRRTAVMDMLTDMQIAGTPVTSKSIAHIIQYTLRPRRAGHRPVVQKERWHNGTENDPNDLNMVIAILKRIMRTGSFVPILHWQEIIRRLGMARRFNDVQTLCHQLANWYGPVAPSSAWPPRRFRIPAQVPTSHHLHPLRILFNTPLQKAIVEWGFIHSLQRRSFSLEDLRRGTVPVIRKHALPVVTSGITLLKELSQQGIYIDGKSVRSAIFNRLITYFGPGRSNRRYNRYAKARLHGSLALVAKQIDEALGGEYFTGIDLPRILNLKAQMRWRRVGRRWNTMIKAKRASSSMPGLGNGERGSGCGALN